MKLPYHSDISSRLFGVAAGGQLVEAWTLTAASGLQLEAISYGARITRLSVPDREGRLEDVVLGFDSLEGYLGSRAYFGAAIGRVAGRIREGNLYVDGRTYQLARNDGPNHLHGGVVGFDKKIWKVEARRNENCEPQLTFLYTSPEGEEGYPGSVQVQITYTVSDENKLIVAVEAEADEATPFNFTQHSYFNLAGEGSGTIAKHRLQIFADEFVPVDDSLALTGKLLSLDGKGNDFRQPRTIEEAIPMLFKNHGDLYRIQSLTCASIDNRSLRKAVRLVHPSSGRVLAVSTTEGFVQFYSGVAIDESHPGKSGHVYKAYSGLCLECQGYPDAANRPELGDILLRPGKAKRFTTVYDFSIHTQENSL